MMSDEDEDDGPQHDPGHSALVVAQPPAEAPARTSTVLVSSSATVAEATLKGYRKQVVWSVYKDVMESVLGEVRQLVEQEGLEPSVATDIREVRPPQRICIWPLRNPTQLLATAVAEMDEARQRFGRFGTPEEISSRAREHSSRRWPSVYRSAAHDPGRHRSGHRSGQAEGRHERCVRLRLRARRRLVQQLGIRQTRPNYGAPPSSTSHATCAPPPPPPPARPPAAAAPSPALRTTAARSPSAEESQKPQREARLVKKALSRTPFRRHYRCIRARRRVCSSGCSSRFGVQDAGLVCRTGTRNTAPNLARSSNIPGASAFDSDVPSLLLAQRVPPLLSAWRISCCCCNMRHCSHCPPVEEVFMAIDPPTSVEWRVERPTPWW